MSEASQKRLVLNGMEFDLDAGLLRGRQGEAIPLRPQSFEVLRHLAANANRVVTRDELLDTVWPGIAVTENSLSQCISEIRKAIGDEQQALLKTVARRGYHLVLREEGPNGAQAVVPSEAAAPAAPSAASKRRRLVGAVLVAALVAAVAATAAFLRPPAKDPIVPDTLSIAVLPFDNLSQVAEQAYLANGFTDDLTSELARVPGLFVVSRNAARGFGDSELAPAKIAAELGVRYLLDGSVQRSGDEVRINAQLVDASTAGQVWADRFDGRFANVFEMQNQVVAKIVGALQLKLVPGKANLAISGDTDNPEAYQAFRRALEKRQEETPDATVEALGYLHQALALDADFGAAAAEMAWLYWDVEDSRRKALGLSWEEVNNRLYESLAIAARNPSPTYYQLVAELKIRERKPDEAMEMLRAAIPLDPSDPWTYYSLAQAFIFAGRPTEARGHIVTSQRLNPKWPDWPRYQIGMAAFGEGKYKEAVEQLRQVDLESPNPWAKFYSLHVLVAALAYLDRPEEAEQALDTLRVVLARAGEGAPDLLIAQQFFVFKEPGDAFRLLAGLKKAGVPDLPPELSESSAQRLSGNDIRKLVFGHELSGRQLLPEVLPYRAIVGIDGAVTKTVGNETESGRFWVQDNFLCHAFPRHLTHCGAVFRNADGTPGAGNEYMHVLRFVRREFSVLK